MSFLVCEQVEKSFGDTRVLDGVSFSLAEGECLALLGASGCGKTTLLNILAGFLSCDAGVVRCDGAVIDDPSSGHCLPVRQRRFAMVFQDFSLWPHLTVARNVAFGLEILGVPRAEREERVRRALDRVGMSHAAERFPSQLSGGQQQRVAIARALVVEPRMILLDEPLSALDAALREDLRDEIGALIRQTGMTAVYVTHDQGEALAIAHRVAVMRAGKIEQLAPPEEIYSRPANAFVAGFIGVSNVANYTYADGALRLKESSHTIPWTSEPPPVPHGKLMVRREALQIHRGHNPADDHQLSLPARCDRCLYQGERYEVTATAGDSGVWRGYTEAPFAMDEPLTLTFPVSAVRFLPS